MNILPTIRRHVVTAFVRQPSSGSILLIQRSDKVSTYPNKWGAISGTIEPNDPTLEYRCLQEISEEVGLRPQLLTCIRRGRPLTIDDPPLHFLVHPFLFHLNNTTTSTSFTPTVNWESSRAEWYQPSHISTLDTVPLLMETWERVEIDMDIGRYGPHAEHALQRIPNDREHGAAELAGWALDALLQEVEEQCAATRGGGGGEGGNKDQQQEKEQAMLLMSHLKNYSYLLAHSRPSMAAPLSAVTAVLNSVQKSSKESKEKAILFTSVDLLNSFSEAVQQEKQKMHDASQQVKQHTIAMLDRNRVTSMLTLSLSSTVRDVIEQYGKLFVDDTSQQKGVFVSSSSSSSSSSSQLKVIVCESRPLFEGVRLADYWKKTNTGIDCTIIIDAAAAKYIDKVDIVLVGADSIRIKRRRKGSEDTMMEVVNKVGTHMVALAAQEAGVDVYVVSDSWKVVGSSSWEGGGIEEEEEGTEEMGAEEVTAAWGDVLGTSSGCSSNVKVENYYFEATPMRLIKGVVTEQGELDARELVVMAEKKGREVEGAFSDDVGVGVGEIR